ncbi:MAG: hypothetical protein IJ518_06235 [Clostridia bacterium]|nr:hypothetical protein [Clostridia bacterium]
MCDSSHCAACGQLLGRDDVGLYKKLMDRAAEKDFLCKACIARKLRCDTALLDEKIRQFREAGCLLFAD